MAVTRGLDILVHVGAKTIGGQRGCTLTMESDTIDVSSKVDFGWASFIGGAKQWSVSCDGQFVVSDEGQKAIMDAFIAGTEVDIEMKNQAETVYYKGKACITSVEVDAQFDDVATLAVEFTGQGALAVKKSI